MDARTLFETWFHRVWHLQDPSAIDELRDDMAGGSGLSDRPFANADYRRMHAQFCGIFETMRIDIERFVQEGDEVAMLLRFTGTTRRGKRVTMRGSGFARVVDARIVEADNLWDIAGLKAQLEEKSVAAAGTVETAARLLEGY